MKIERIISKDENNVFVYFDDSEKLIISKEVFYQSGLRKGDEISEDRFLFFITQNQLYFVKQRALAYLARRAHSERELFIKLKKKKYDDSLIKAVINNLHQMSYLNDHNFAVHFIDEKLKKKRWGRNKIKAALFGKGVNGSTINEALKEFEDEKNDFELAMELALKKLEQLNKRNLNHNKKYQKISSFLISRGIDFDICREVCDKIFKSESN
jgi:regulatory protein